LEVEAKLITVERDSHHSYRVTVDGANRTHHRVTVPDAYHKALTGEACSPEDLVTASFEFLLQYEPNTMILRSFDLPVIQTYFSQYESVMKQIFIQPNSEPERS
jgi:hypothetical protein